MTTSDAPLDALQETLAQALGSDRVARNRPLGPLTTFRIGGPADLFVEPRSEDELVFCLEAASRHDVPVTLLGGGSNVLVADRGVRGLVLRPQDRRIVLESPSRVRAAAGVTINGLVRWMIGHGLSGLEAWAGTPGTVGGGIYGNAHYGGRLLSEYVVSVRLATPAGDVIDVPADQMAFAYDRSRLQESGEILLSAVFAVSPGQPDALRATARESLAYRKRTQPLAAPSAGCIFRNPGPDEVPDGIPASAGALIDRAGLKGAREGGAMVSPTHANFIVNAGDATAADIRRLVERCRAAVERRFGIRLLEEIVYMGDFEQDGGDGSHSAQGKPDGRHAR
ncbi:MAG TPA: UDP-N-acetylmuramate dehydrogenase [Vicinamibacterales bacterium]